MKGSLILCVRLWVWKLRLIPPGHDVRQRCLPDGVMLEVGCEHAVDDLEAQAHRIVGHRGLDSEDACLAFHETQRPVRTASVLQVRQPIYRSSVGRWRPYAHMLQPLLEALDGARRDERFA